MRIWKGIAKCCRAWIGWGSGSTPADAESDSAWVATSLIVALLGVAAVLMLWPSGDENPGNNQALSQPSATVSDSMATRPASTVTDPSRQSPFEALAQKSAAAAGSSRSARSPQGAGISFTIRGVVAAGLCFLAGGLAVRNLVPLTAEWLSRRCNPWARAAERAAEAALALPGPDAPTEAARASDGVESPGEETAAGEPRSAEAALEEFFASAAKDLVVARGFLSEIARTRDNAGRRKLLLDLACQIGSLKRKSGLPAVLPVLQMSFAMEGLLNQLTQRPESVNASAHRTLLGAVDLLEALCQPGLKPDLAGEPPVRLLVVDDDPVSRLAISNTLKKTFPPPEAAKDGPAALALVAKSAYDVIFLDVQMPGMDGFEVCWRIHQSDANRLTPVVFVTCLGDFEARAKSSRAGGHELIAKPFLSCEIVLKALTLVLAARHRANAEKSAAMQATNPVSSASAKEVSPIGKPSTTGVPQPSPGDFADALFTHAPVQLEAARRGLQALKDATDAAARQETLGELYIQIHALRADAEWAELRSACRLSGALQGLVKKLLDQPKQATDSMLTAANAALELLEDLCRNRSNPDLANPALRVLVVDDDPIARRTICGGLQLAIGKPDCAESGEAAFALATEKPFDVIFLDVMMPGMDGFAACSKIRETTANGTTPIVFVTSHSDAESRAQAARCGGNGFISKPVLPSEIGVTALTFCLRNRLARRQTALIREAVAV